jgi:hypothetical protein
MSSRLALEATWWMYHLNCEFVCCWLPTFDQVCAGEHVVTALGNDGIAVNIVVNNEAAAAGAAAHGLTVDEVHLVYVGKLLRHYRNEEAKGNPA